MGWFDKAVSREVVKGVESALNDFCKPGGGLDEIVERCAYKVIDEKLTPGARLTPAGFLWAMKICLHRHGATYQQAHDAALAAIKDFLADEGIEFGHPDYAWTREGAEEIAHEYELRHWEAAA